MANLFQKLMFSASTTALIASSVLVNHAYAQAAATKAAAPSGDDIEEVVVTGTSIKGVNLVGSNVSQVTAADITDIGVADVTQALISAPAIEGFGNAGRGTATSTNGGVGVALYIHDIGAMGTGSTLVLVDGHRAAESGQLNYFVNPNVLPTNMLERVDILSDGASAVYGTDAIAGVINFVTRKQFEGIQFGAQKTFTDGSVGDSKYNLLVGHSWDTGNFVIGAEYAYNGLLRDTARPWTNPLTQGARAAAAGLSGPNPSNFGNFNCSPATIQPSGSSGIYLSPTSTSSVANSAANSICNGSWQYGALLPSESRENMMMKVWQQIFPRVTMEVDTVISSRQDYSPVSRGTLTATAFGAGPQANPFYVDPPGVTATQQTVRYDFDALLGPGAYSKGAEDTMQGTATFTYNVDDNWEIDFLTSLGRDSNETNTFNTVNSSAELLALNGTAQASGSTTTSDIPGYAPGVVTQLPLTTANALDVWSPAASNKTSASVLGGLTNNESLAVGIFEYDQERLSATGTLFSLPAGPVKIAVGAELYNIVGNDYSYKPGLAAVGTADATDSDYFYRRNDIAEYAEANIPVISPAMNIPLAQKVTLDVAARRDDYSDVGSTVNPKVGFTWSVFQDLDLRGDWSTTFEAPPMPLTGFSTNGGGSGNNIGAAPAESAVLVKFFPLVTQLGIPGCTTASVSCSLATVQGISKLDGNPNVTVVHGRSWSVGADYTPSYLPGFTLNLTYWDTELLGGVVGPMFAQAVIGPLANDGFLTLYPNCATPAQIAAFAQVPARPGTTPLQNPQTSSFPACAQFLYKNEPYNLQYNYVDGIDLTANYRFSLESVIGRDIGAFTLGTSLTQIMKFIDAYNFGPPAPSALFNANNTDGLNGWPAVAFTSRTHIGWIWNGVLADIWMNYEGGYEDINTTALNPIGAFPNGTPDINIGGDHVSALVTFDAHLGYAFDGGMLGDALVSFNVNNVFDREPPYYNASAGYDPSVGNPMGRTFSLSLTLKK